MSNGGRVIALGFFDGLHLGHAALIHESKRVAAEIGAIPTVSSFDRHPGSAVRGTEVPLIQSLTDRAALLRIMFGIEDVILLHFDNALMTCAWDEFLSSLCREWDARHLVAGYDYHFGYRGTGNAELLSAWCRENGIGYSIVPELTLNGVRVSSTVIRELLKDGDITAANQFLGYPFFFSGVVDFGFRFGRTIGFPTVNMAFEPGVIIPASGVYITRTTLPDGQSFPSITNVGYRPTVSAGESLSVETHIPGFAGNLYGQKLTIAFYQYLREEKAFDSADALKAQIADDVLSAEQFFD